MPVEEIWNALENKLIAILRGIKPDEVQLVVKELLDAGFGAIEIPLNSPDAFRSIEIAVKTAQEHASSHYLIGAGTVLSVEQVESVKNAGGNLIVSPNINPQIIRKTKKQGMFSAPGVYTPTECLMAIDAGADCLKVFPASNSGTSGIKALTAILPSSIPLCAVGGVGPDNFGEYLQAGAVAFGLGSSLYAPGMSAHEVGKRAKLSIQKFSEFKS